MIVLITGASGWIGGYVCKWLTAAGCVVRKAVRRPRTVNEFAWNCAKPVGNSQLHAALDGCHAVVHCASHVHRPVESSEEVSLFHQVNVEGTRQLLEVCLATGVNRIVYASTIGVYRWNDAEPKDEDADVEPVTEYCRTKLEGEKIVRSSGLDWRIARLATVYGDGDKANFLKLARALQAGRFRIPGTGSARKSVLTVTRAAELLGRLTLLPETTYRTVNLASSYAPTLREICDSFSSVCGFRRAASLPYWLVAPVASVGDLLNRSGAPFPLTSETLRKAITNTVVDVGRQQRLFGDLSWNGFAEDLSEFQDYYR